MAADQSERPPARLIPLYGAAAREAVTGVRSFQIQVSASSPRPKDSCIHC